MTQNLSINEAPRHLVTPIATAECDSIQRH
jgi:hypothetical protein